jgi:nucleotide-binding universal stress UspA family protein
MKIICATDFSEPGQAAETKALELAGALRAELVYVHVASQPMLYSESVFAMEEAKRVYEAQARWAEETLQTRVSAAQAAGVTARRVLREGAAYEQIVGAARDEKADMIVIGTHGRSGVNRLLLGSVAERVVRLAPCPVLTVRAHDAR